MHSFGLVQVYTGNGKGKTTAAIGQALRACGHGARVIMIQFMKGREYGELKSAAHLPGLRIFQYGRDEFVDKRNPETVDIDLARQGFEKAAKIMEYHECDLLILDEANVAIDYGLLKLDDVLNLLQNKPAEMEVILTGRNAARELMAMADLVTEMLEIKHPYQRKIEMRKGIDY